MVVLQVLANNKSKFSLVSWVTGSAPTGLLLPKSAQDTPWFTYFALEIEQQKLFTINGLWKQLVLDLSTSSGKTNIDATIKVFIIILFVCFSLFSIVGGSIAVLWFPIVSFLCLPHNSVSKEGHQNCPKLCMATSFHRNFLVVPR